MFEYKAKVIRVIDGDTLEVDIDLGFKIILRKEKLRLLEIDTPELRSSDANERKEAQVAKKFVQDVLPENGNIIVRTKKDKKGKYGRYLANVFFFDDNEKLICLNEMLIEQGYKNE